MRPASAVLLAILCLATPASHAADSTSEALSARNYLLPGEVGEYEMLFVPGGVLEAGSRASMAELALEHSTTSWAMESERPLTTVELEPFWLGRTEVTVGMFRKFVQATKYQTRAEKEGFVQGEWQADGDEYPGLNWANPGYLVTDQHPVTCLAWEDIVAYLEWLNARTGQTYHMPVETQFEYAARAGTEGSWYFGNDKEQMDTYEVYALNNTGGASPVGSLKANPWGFMDMLGNVRERLSNPWDHNTINTVWNMKPDYSRPHAPQLAQHSVSATRGMSWSSDPIWLRASARNVHPFSHRNAYTGFRLARMADAATGLPPTITVAGTLAVEGVEDTTGWMLDFVPADWSRGAVRARRDGDGAFQANLWPGKYVATLRNKDKDLFVLPREVSVSAKTTTLDVRAAFSNLTVWIPEPPAVETPKDAKPNTDLYLRVNHRSGSLRNQPLFSRAVEGTSTEVALPPGEYRFEVLASNHRLAATDWVRLPQTKETTVKWQAVETPPQTLYATVTIPPGSYTYKFWNAQDRYDADPLNPCVSDDEFKNSCFTVPGGAIGPDGTRAEWPKVNDRTGEVKFKFVSTTPGATFVRGSFNKWKPEGKFRMK